MRAEATTEDIYCMVKIPRTGAAPALFLEAFMRYSDLRLVRVKETPDQFHLYINAWYSEAQGIANYINEGLDSCL